MEEVEAQERVRADWEAAGGGAGGGGGGEGPAKPGMHLVAPLFMGLRTDSADLREWVEEAWANETAMAGGRQPGEAAEAGAAGAQARILGGGGSACWRSSASCRSCR